MKPLSSFSLCRSLPPSLSTSCWPVEDRAAQGSLWTSWTHTGDATLWYCSISVYTTELQYTLLQYLCLHHRHCTTLLHYLCLHHRHYTILLQSVYTTDTALRYCNISVYTTDTILHYCSTSVYTTDTVLHYWSISVYITDTIR